MNLDKRTVILVGASTAVTFLVDYHQYSYGRSGNSLRHFRYFKPEAKEVLMILAVGISAGVFIDFMIRNIESLVKTNEEKKLDVLVEQETDKIRKGLYDNQLPKKIEWV